MEFIPLLALSSGVRMGLLTFDTLSVHAVGELHEVGYNITRDIHGKYRTCYSIVLRFMSTDSASDTYPSFLPRFAVGVFRSASSRLRSFATIPNLSCDYDVWRRVDVPLLVVIVTVRQTHVMGIDDVARFLLCFGSNIVIDGC